MLDANSGILVPYLVLSFVNMRDTTDLYGTE